jgi:hypothetical protein
MLEEEIVIVWAPTEENATSIESASRARLDMPSTFKTRLPVFSSVRPLQHRLRQPGALYRDL